MITEISCDIDPFVPLDLVMSNLNALLIKRASAGRRATRHGAAVPNRRPRAQLTSCFELFHAAPEQQDGQP
jgi:hypothetical protein